MGFSKKQVAVALLCLSSIAALSAQSDNKASLKAQILGLQASNIDREMKMDLLREIENGNISMDADTISVLAILAGDGTVYRNSSVGREYNNADIRMRAIYALGRVGGEDARSYILTCLDAEDDPNTKSVAFIALADMGPGPDKTTVRVMNDAITREIARSHSDSAAIDYLVSIQKLVSSSNVDMETLELVTRLASGDTGFSNKVRLEARSFLRNLWK